MGFTSSQTQELRKAIAQAEKTGHPEVAMRIRAAMKADTPFDLIMLSLDNEAMAPPKVNPETDIDPRDAETLMPPRAGKGATKKAWHEWALIVSNLEPEVVASFSRDDTVAVLEERGILLPEEL
jgi:hypothetical protein